ncbi:hypothetical protein PXK30_09845 [Phaeobacter gallaeciensis]|uniref:hypothetical protein n=1 Tax=Phaeobacter gallaeciensis TaxID=60890 RepID=UPI00237FA3E8|nr:hypothetical protein [Phaeobacter gallaeciensis]MDE4303574.1 hypothetical protein [Phaeobacter gallaeciensis]MDE4307944.1 hypothetical protein [Phaeobacter gallaeciensis]MDE4312402.1 hypothetical protein [Phaeobacter gallaeciensis]MDE4316873.1 hypothetical protein [Phaeobacter gallaeciensis]MDE4321336.1 hypothetical protein [Phaeobacter gallaeciensis]
MTDLSLREQICDKLSEMLVDADLAKVSDTVFADAAADAILELLKGAVPTWQPIETAPKDGTPILLYSDDAVAQGRMKRAGGCAVDWWHDAKRDGCTFTGWGKFNKTYWPPSHWVALPPTQSIQRRRRAALGVK